MGKVILITVLSLCFYLVGCLQPSAVLLDVSFGLGDFVTDQLGLWRPGPLWVNENRFLSLFCFLLWPLMLSTAYGYTTIAMAGKIRGGHRSILYIY